jgi:hypothetical protein
MPCSRGSSRGRSNRITWEQLHSENHTPRLEQESETAAVSQALAAMSTIKLCASLVNPPPPWVLHINPSCPPLEAETNMLQLKLQTAFLLFPKTSLPTQLGPLRKKSKQHRCYKSSILLHKKWLGFTKECHMVRGMPIWAQSFRMHSIIY